jgi:hypothetical protein
MSGTDAGIGGAGGAATVDPQGCNALTLGPAGLLVPRVVPFGVAPGGAVGTARSVDIDVTDTGGKDCPDTWQIGARLSPVSGEADLGAQTNLLANPGNWVPTALTITLPEVGRYAVHWNAQGQICAQASHSSNRWLQVRVINSATGAALSGTRSPCQHQFATVAGQTLQACVTGNATISHQVTVTTAPLTLRLQGGAFGPEGTWQSATIQAGETHVFFHKISD